MIEKNINIIKLIFILSKKYCFNFIKKMYSSLFFDQEEYDSNVCSNSISEYNFLKFNKTEKEDYDSDEKNIYKIPTDYSSSSVNSSSANKILNTKRRKEISKEKKANLLEKNKESARNSRRRKKAVFEQLVEENIKLKKEILTLKLKLNQNICESCGNKLGNGPVLKPNLPKMTQSSFKSRKGLFFLTSTVVVLCIILNFFSNEISQKIENVKHIRRLTKSNKIVKFSELQMRNFTVNGMFISYGDYYYLLSGKRYFLKDQYEYTTENLGKVRLLKNEEIGKVPIDECPYCVIELNSSNFIKQKHFKFKLFINNHRFWEDNNSNRKEYYFEIDCEGIGFSKNEMINTKINRTNNNDLINNNEYNII